MLNGYYPFEWIAVALVTAFFACLVGILVARNIKADNKAILAFISLLLIIIASNTFDDKYVHQLSQVNGEKKSLFEPLFDCKPFKTLLYDRKDADPLLYESARSAIKNGHCESGSLATALFSVMLFGLAVFISSFLFISFLNNALKLRAGKEAAVNKKEEELQEQLMPKEENLYKNLHDKKILDELYERLKKEFQAQGRAEWLLFRKFLLNDSYLGLDKNKLFYEGFNGKFKGGRYTGVTIDNTLKALGKFPKIETFIKILEWSAFSANLSLLELLIQYEELRIPEQNKVKLEYD